MCFWRHKWSKWEPYTQRMIRLSDGMKYSVHMQRRVCDICGKIQEEEV